MIANYLKVALRNLRRHRAYTLINLSGLAVGFGVSLLVLLLAWKLLSWDAFHEHANDTYLVLHEHQTTVGTHRNRTTWAPLLPALQGTYSSIVSGTRVEEVGHQVRVDGRVFGEQIYYEYHDQAARTYRLIYALIGLFVLLIACINFMNLATARSMERAKEVGVRKVVGTSATALALLLTKDIVRLLVIAFAVALPLGYVGVPQWLEQFAYRASLPAWYFVGACGVILTLALFTVSTQTLRAARLDPVNALRTESRNLNTMLRPCLPIVGRTPCQQCYAVVLSCWLLLASSGWVHGQSTGYAPGDGVDLHYTTFGSGAPLLVLNGGPGFPSRHFYPLAESLAVGRQVILFDQRGTGRSPRSALNDSTVTVAAMVKDIEAVRRHLGIEQWTVMGHSWGGMYALLYAARHPARVEALILSASGGINLEFTRGFSDRLRALLTEGEREALDRWSNPDRIAENPDQARRARTRAMAPAYVYRREHVPTVVRMLTEESGFEPAVNRLVWADLRRMGYDLSASMHTFRKPVLIVQGRDDFLGEAVPRDIHAAFPQSRLVLIDDCRHYLWLDQPDRYFTTLRAFLASAKNMHSSNS